MTTDVDRVTRRSLLTGAGAAVAVGVGAAATDPADAAEASTRRRVGAGPDDLTVAEFRGRISQTGDSGQRFHATGFLTRLRGARVADLFHGTPHSVHTALFTVYATGELKNRVLDMSVHALDIHGSLTVYQRATPGAHFDDRASFRVGHVAAGFSLVLQDVLTVFAPATGIPTLTGDMRQTRSAKLHGGLAGRHFGVHGQRLRMFATGLGHLTDPQTLNADLEIAGNWTAT
jgi:hypothetical protein